MELLLMSLLLLLFLLQYKLVFPDQTSTAADTITRDFGILYVYRVWQISVNVKVNEKIKGTAVPVFN
jgi:hypothetical protein